MNNILAIMKDVAYFTLQFIIFVIVSVTCVLAITFVFTILLQMILNIIC